MRLHRCLPALALLLLLPAGADETRGERPAEGARGEDGSGCGDGEACGRARGLPDRGARSRDRSPASYHPRRGPPAPRSAASGRGRAPGRHAAGRNQDDAARPGARQPLRRPEESRRNPHERMRPRHGRSASLPRGRARTRSGPSDPREIGPHGAPISSPAPSPRDGRRPAASRGGEHRHRQYRSGGNRPQRPDGGRARRRKRGHDARPAASHRVPAGRRDLGRAPQEHRHDSRECELRPPRVHRDDRRPGLDPRLQRLLRFRRSPRRGNVVREGAREQVRRLGPRRHECRHDRAVQQQPRPNGLLHGDSLLSRPRQHPRVEHQLPHGRPARVRPRARVLLGRDFHRIVPGQPAGHLRPLHLRRHARPDVGQAHERPARDVRGQHGQPHVVRHGGERVRGLVSRQEAAAARDGSRGCGRRLLRRHIPLRGCALESGRHGADRRGGCRARPRMAAARSRRASPARSRSSTAERAISRSRSRTPRTRARSASSSRTTSQKTWTVSLPAARMPRSRSRPSS